MGLDMTIYKTQKGEKINWRNRDEINEVAYWRKFNALHAWFVKHVQNGEDDCEEYIIPRAQLDYLVTYILEPISKHPEFAPNLLPTESVFFFGGTEYGESYYEDVRRSIPLIHKLLKETDFETEDLYYSASW